MIDLDDNRTGPQIPFKKSPLTGRREDRAFPRAGIRDGTGGFLMPENGAKTGAARSQPVKHVEIPVVRE